MPAGLVPVLGAFVLLFYLVLGSVLGALSTLVTVPVFWWTGHGFVPRALVDSTENFGEETFLVFVHVAVGTICYVIGFSTWALLVNLGLGLWEASVSFVVVTAFAWVAFDAWPVLRGYGTPSGWWSASLGSFALYALAFLGGSVGLVHVLFG